MELLIFMVVMAKKSNFQIWLLLSAKMYLSIIIHFVANAA